MRPTISVDISGLQRMIKARIEATGHAVPKVINQTGLNVVHRVLDRLPPENPEAKRNEISAYLNRQISARVRFLKSGKRKGQSTQRGTKRSQARLVYLIQQARRKKRGKKGLYGDPMARSVSARFGHSISSVGFSKSLWIPIVRALNPLCRFKVPFSLTRNIARWPNSAGYGIATVAERGLSPLLTLRVGARLKNPSQFLGTMESSALRTAIRAEEREMRRHLEESLKAAA